MSDILLSVRDLRRAFGSVQAVQGMSFDLRRGESVGLIGANGAGKTTTMRILVGLDAPDAGHIVYDDVDVEENPVRLRGRVGWMPDALFPPAHTTVWDYVDFFARAFGLRGESRLAEVQRVLEFCGVAGMQDRLVDKLSKGEMQRVNLARMLVGDPELVVMDEPAAGLDPRARVEFKHCVRELQKQGKTLLISSHIISELAEMCDSVILMDKGRILYQGACAEVQPKQQRVVYEFAVAGDGAGELQRELEQHPEWKEVQLVTPGCVRAEYTGEDGEPLALQLRALSAAHLLTRVERCKETLEETVINMMNDHEK